MKEKVIVKRKQVLLKIMKLPYRIASEHQILTKIS